MMPIFGGNPFASTVGQRIDQATDANLASENWALNMEICDIINETDEGPKDAVRAIKKKIQSNVGRNYTVIQYTLTILETCVKNCGRRFHIHVATKDFLQELVKVLSPKNDAPTVVQDRILALIQSWANAFRSSPDLKDVEKVYLDLKAKGIEFPVTDVDSDVPILTPERSVGDDTSSPAMPGLPKNRQTTRATLPASLRQPAFGSTRSVVTLPLPPTPASCAATPASPAAQPLGGQASSAQITKLRSELDVVQGNCRVFNEMLNELGPGGGSQQTADDLQLLRDLDSTCRQMQRRVVELIEHVNDERVTEQLLLVNDELNNVFLRYERFERQRVNQASQATASAQQAPQLSSLMAPPVSAVPPSTYPPASSQLASNLIDFGNRREPASQTVSTSNEASVGLQLGAVTREQSAAASGSSRSEMPPSYNVVVDDEFDMLASSRKPVSPPLTMRPKAPVSPPQAASVLPSAAGAPASAQRDSDSLLYWRDANQLQSWMTMSASEGGVAAQSVLQPAMSPQAASRPLAAPAALTTQRDSDATLYWRDADELSTWMSKTNTNDTADVTAPTYSEPATTSSEFDRFLSERAKAAECLPDGTSAAQPSANGGNSMPPLPPRARQMQKDEPTKSLFAL